MTEVAPGLWRWTAGHPDWRQARKRDSASDWPREVDRRVHVLTTISWHRRSRDEVLERFGGDREAPPGVEALRLRGAGETLFWLSYLRPPVGHAELRELLRHVLDLDVEHVLVSHGEPVVGGGRAALRAAIG